MFKKILLLFLLSLGQLIFSQNIDRIEFESLNAIILGSQVNIDLIPMKNNKKGKIKVYFKTKIVFLLKKFQKKNMLKYVTPF